MIEGATYLNILFLSQTHCGIFKHETVFVMEEYLSTVKLFLFRSIMPIQYSFHYVLLCKLGFEPKYHMDGDEGIYLPIFTFCLSIIHQVPTITRFHCKKKVWISYNFHLLESWILIEKIIILIKPNSNKIIFFREDSTCIMFSRPWCSIYLID